MAVKYSSKLQKAIEDVNKVFGAGAIIDLEGEVKNIDIVCSTGSRNLNKAIGVGGWPKGRIIEIKGPESSGKTTLALHAIAEAQKAGVDACFIDAEHAVDIFYATNLGVNKERLILSQPDSGEQALEIAYAMVIGGAGLVVIDSVAALIPQAELDADFGASKMGLQARLMSQAMRKLRGVVNETGCTMIFINQIRQKIGVTWGSNETEPGGMALKFYASIRIDIRRIATNKVMIDGVEEAISNRVKVKVIKNKVAPPFKVVEFDIIFGIGISKESELIDMGVDYEFLLETGSGIMLNYDTPFYPKTIPIETTSAKTAEALNKREEFALLKKEIEWICKLEDKEVTEEEFQAEFAEDYTKAEEKLQIAAELWEEHGYYSGKSMPEEALYLLHIAEENNPFDKKIKQKIKALEKKVDEKRVKSTVKTILEFKDGSTINTETGEETPATAITIEETKEVIESKEKPDVESKKS